MMYPELLYILPTTTYYLTLPTLTKLLSTSSSPEPSPQIISLYLLLYHLPYPLFTYTTLISGPNASNPSPNLLLPVSLALLLLAQTLSTPLPLLPALPLLSFIRACGAASVTKLPVHQLARADFVCTCLTAFVALIPLLPSCVFWAYLVLLFFSTVYLLRKQDDSTDGDDGEETPLLKPTTPKYGVRMLLPLCLTMFATGSIHHLLPILSASSHPALLSLLCLTTLSEPLFQRISLAHSQILGSLLVLCGSVSLWKDWLSLSVLLLGCGGCAVGVCSIRDVMNSGCDLGGVVVIVGVMFAIGECVGITIAGVSPDGWVWTCVSTAVLGALMLREGVRMVTNLGANYGFIGVGRGDRNGESLEPNH